MDRRVVGILGTVGLVALTQLLAVALADPFGEAGLQVADGSGGLWALAPIALGILLGTLLVLAIARYGLDPGLVRVVILGSLAVAVGLVVETVLPVGPLVAFGFASLVALVVWLYPEWYVVNTVAVVAVAGVTAILGTSLSMLTAIIALVAMAIYDAYAVYGSGHMVEMADASARMGAPTMFVVPTERGTSTRNLQGVGTGGGGSTIAMLGAGDALFPGVLVVAALGVGDVVFGPFTVAALGAFAGSLLGLVMLQVYVHRVSGVHAGLPILNAATIVGYLLAVLLTGGSLLGAIGL
jgi:presenilin-like A22 family membrane protease